MKDIDPSKEYSLQDVVDHQFIPGVKGYAKAYDLVTTKELEDEKFVRCLVKETTRAHLKPIDSKRGWNKISCKIKIEGKEIVKFLQLNDLL